MVRWLGWLIMIEHLNLILTDEICLGASLGQFFFLWWRLQNYSITWDDNPLLYPNPILNFFHRFVGGSPTMVSARNVFRAPTFLA